MQNQRLHRKLMTVIAQQCHLTIILCQESSRTLPVINREKSIFNCLKRIYLKIIRSNKRGENTSCYRRHGEVILITTQFKIWLSGKSYSEILRNALRSCIYTNKKYFTKINFNLIMNQFLIVMC